MKEENDITYAITFTSPIRLVNESYRTEIKGVNNERNNQAYRTRTAAATFGRLSSKNGGRHTPPLIWHCSLQTARRIYDFGCNSLEYLCQQLNIPEGQHHCAGDDAEMCARLYLKELKDI